MGKNQLKKIRHKQLKTTQLSFEGVAVTYLEIDQLIMFEFLQTKWVTIWVIIVLEGLSHEFCFYLSFYIFLFSFFFFSHTPSVIVFITGYN